MVHLSSEYVSLADSGPCLSEYVSLASVRSARGRFVQMSVCGTPVLQVSLVDPSFVSVGVRLGRLAALGSRGVGYSCMCVVHLWCKPAQILCRSDVCSKLD